MSLPPTSTTDRWHELLRAVPDFPEPGVVFRDITPLLADPAAFGEVVAALGELATRTYGAVDVIAGMEARGFILGAALAQHLGAGFVPLRKAGKLPPPVESVSYDLEYGQASLELSTGTLHPGARVLLVDDILATGGTAAAAARLVTVSGGVVAGSVFLLEIDGLGGRGVLGDVPVETLLVTRP